MPIIEKRTLPSYVFTIFINYIDHRGLIGKDMVNFTGKGDGDIEEQIKAFCIEKKFQNYYVNLVDKKPCQ